MPEDGGVLAPGRAEVRLLQPEEEVWRLQAFHPGAAAAAADAHDAHDAHERATGFSFSFRSRLGA